RSPQTGSSTDGFPLVRMRPWVATHQGGVMTVLKVEPRRQAATVDLETGLIDYAHRVEELRSPDEVLDELHAVTMRHLPLAVLGAARLPLKSGDWASLQLGTTVFLHRSVPEGWWKEFQAVA